MNPSVRARAARRHTSIIWWLGADSMPSTYRSYRISGYCRIQLGTSVQEKYELRPALECGSSQHANDSQYVQDRAVNNYAGIWFDVPRPSGSSTGTMQSPSAGFKTASKR